MVKNNNSIDKNWIQHWKQRGTALSAPSAPGAVGMKTPGPARDDGAGTSISEQVGINTTDLRDKPNAGMK